MRSSTKKTDSTTGSETGESLGGGASATPGSPALDPETQALDATLASAGTDQTPGLTEASTDHATISIASDSGGACAAHPKIQALTAILLSADTNQTAELSEALINIFHAVVHEFPHKNFIAEILFSQLKKITEQRTETAMCQVMSYKKDDNDSIVDLLMKDVIDYQVVSSYFIDLLLQDEPQYGMLLQIVSSTWLVSIKYSTGLEFKRLMQKIVSHEAQLGQYIRETHLRTLTLESQFDLLDKALDRTTPLGEFFYIRGHIWPFTRKFRQLRLLHEHLKTLQSSPSGLAEIIFTGRYNYIQIFEEHLLGLQHRDHLGHPEDSFLPHLFKKFHLISSGENHNISQTEIQAAKARFKEILAIQPLTMWTIEGPKTYQCNLGQFVFWMQQSYIAQKYLGNLLNKVFDESGVPKYPTDDALMADYTYYTTGIPIRFGGCSHYDGYPGVTPNCLMLLENFSKTHPSKLLDLLTMHTTDGGSIGHVIAQTKGGTPLNQQLLSLLINISETIPDKLLTFLMIKNNFGSTIMHRIATHQNQDVNQQFIDWLTADSLVPVSSADGGAATKAAEPITAGFTPDEVMTLLLTKNTVQKTFFDLLLFAKPGAIKILYDLIESDWMQRLSDSTADIFIKTLAKHKTLLCVHICNQILPALETNVQKISLLDEIRSRRSRRSPLGQIFWTSRGATACSIATGELMHLDQAYQKLASEHRTQPQGDSSPKRFFEMARVGPPAAEADSEPDVDVACK